MNNSKMEYDRFCSFNANSYDFSGFIQHLQEELKDKVMSASKEETEVLKIKHSYLTELLTRVQNSEFEYQPLTISRPNY